MGVNYPKAHFESKATSSILLGFIITKASKSPLNFTRLKLEKVFTQIILSFII